MIAVQLPPEIERRLEELAERTGKPTSFHVEQAVLEHLDELDDINLAEQRLAEIKAGRTRSVSLDSLIAKYGLAD